MKHIIICLQGEYKKDELLEAARSGNEEKLMALLTTLNVNCHASDGRKVSQMLFTLRPYFFLILGLQIFFLQNIKVGGGKKIKIKITKKFFFI